MTHNNEGGKLWDGCCLLKVSPGKLRARKAFEARQSRSPSKAESGAFLQQLLQEVAVAVAAVLRQS